MHCDQLDFNRIFRALKDTYTTLGAESASSQELTGMSEAQENYLHALSHATLIDPKLLKYIQD
ncbi:DUF3921 family protein [Bacillus salitolerans]|uniref:DUF3921 family protein n=1 Tax=Bacillus salitolerans TaxID=1437434 RepID=A0ABW4LTK1_9BACI